MNRDDTACTIRVHHLLCMPLFCGKGYSQEFVENMGNVIQEVRSSKEIILVTTSDQICKACPNKTNEERCGLDNDEVSGKDECLLTALQLEKEVRYKTDFLFRWLQTHLTKEIFEASCKHCKWYREGLCNYENYKYHRNKFDKQLIACYIE